MAPAFTPVILPVQPSLVSAVLVPWLTAGEVFRLVVLPFLDTYEVLFTNMKFSGYISSNQQIATWYLDHMWLQAQGIFFADPSVPAVRTSKGKMVYSDPGSVILVQWTSLYPTQLAYDGWGTSSP